MNVSAIDATSSTSAKQASAAQAAPTRKSPPPAAKGGASSGATVAALSTPAATVSTTSVPASVKPEDRAEYLQLLKALGGNVNAALAAVQARDSAKTEA